MPDDVIQQVEETRFFFETVQKYIEQRITE